MGLIDKVTTALVKDALSNAAEGALDVTIKAMDKAGNATETLGNIVEKTIGDAATRHYKKEQKYMDSMPGKLHLIIQRGESRRKKFSVYNRNEELMYYVQGKDDGDKVNLHLYNSSNKECGSVKKAMLAVRNPLFHENKPADYLIEERGYKTTTLKTKRVSDREKYEIQPQGWTIKTKVFQWDFSIMCGEKELIHVSRRKDYDRPTYIIDFEDPKYEILGLLITLTLISRE